MSTLLYASLTNDRQARATRAAANSQEDEPAPAAGNQSDYLTILAALVPAEILVVHGLIISATTDTKPLQATAGVKDGREENVIIMDRTALKAGFYSLLALSMILYAAGRFAAKKWEKRDYVRIFIPALAFVCWTMLQRATAFDALGINISDGTRSVVALLLAVVLGVGVKLLAYAVDTPAGGDPPPVE